MKMKYWLVNVKYWLLDIIGMEMGVEESTEAMMMNYWTDVQSNLNGLYLIFLRGKGSWH